MNVGKGMVKAWLFALANPGCTKRAIAKALVDSGHPAPGYPTVDRAISAGLVRVAKIRGDYYECYAVAMADLPLPTVRGLANAYRRADVELPAGLVDRLNESTERAG